MRISSSQYFTMNVQTMSDQQASLAAQYAQISSGKRIQTASDDPLGAAQAVQLSSQSATLSQYSTNQSAALTSLQQEDSTLTSIGNVMQSVQTLVNRAGNASFNDTDRASMATQLQGYRDNLMTLSNSTDANGNYIFSGFKGTTQPFTDNASGTGATYAGDNGQRQVQISDNRSINVADNGATVFQSVSPNESLPVSSSAAGNTGSGTIGAVNVSDRGNPGNASTYTISFATSGTGSTATTTYTVKDQNGATITPATPYVAQQDIALGGGQKVAIDGAPANGDSFTVAPANTGKASDTDIFSTLDSLISALKQPTSGNPAAQATLQNALTTGGTKVNNMYNNVLTTQASVGGREQEVTATQTAMQTTSTQTASSLQDLTSINLVSSISQYELTQNALQGAQQAFASIQKMSLFQYISS
ncbi:MULTISPECIES: flagellar hook-associated protein FlgL [Burkholderiaceae]|jgi:flagellar hook-associated protein 3 FlgL|uniref:Flagellar hook-associated protein FlgL n=1 Tax=Caballeronia sordidicola TaxID=196367 RepID=A0A242M971_CABSO|nr:MULTISPECIES: flagellar hook-associated protein FlgL [Burkholderiaceae]AME23337.1 flagellar biosynthesis protein FlgL [Burkholderia sp. PAMC 26561]MDP9155242.1 flagellar hook-associated protein FlgL [Pseudomonadota bacterium]OTP67452.1 Flagellar hook-associated protein FlgL [Caballeronia sordidicola]